MKEFLSRHSYIIVWVLALVIVGSIAILIVDLNGITTGPLLPRPNTVANIPVIPAVPPPPSVTLTIVKAPKGNSLIVQWGNLPSNTTELDIYRGKTATTTVYSLWKTISLAGDNLNSGSANIDLGADLENGYSFYVQASSGNNNSSSTGGGGGTIFWVSSSTVPLVTTSTPPGNGDGGSPSPTPPPTPSPTPTPPGDNPSSTSSSTSPTPPPPAPTPTPTPTPSPSPSPTPTGIPYYNPQVQITGYGAEPGSFWVEHVNQSIEIGWQNLPDGITSIVVARSASSTGSWNTIVNQANPGTSGSYSLQIVDDTINDPYYYEMTAFDGTSTAGTYGPVFLAGN